MKEKSMYKKYTDKEINRKEYCNWWAQQKGYVNYSEYCKQYKESNREQVLEKKKQYRQQNKKKVYLQQKNWYSNHPEFKEQKKQYYQENKECISKQRKKYRQDNKEKITKQKKHYSLNNRKNISEQKRKYYKTPRGKVTINKSISKRKHNLGYNVLNPQDVANPKYVGHHLDKENVLFIPEEIHKSVSHSVLKNKNMEIINSKCYNWYYNRNKY